MTNLGNDRIQFAAWRRSPCLTIPFSCPACHHFTKLSHDFHTFRGASACRECRTHHGTEIPASSLLESDCESNEPSSIHTSSWFQRKNHLQYSHGQSAPHPISHWEHCHIAMKEYGKNHRKGNKSIHHAEGPYCCKAPEEMMPASAHAEIEHTASPATMLRTLPFTGCDDKEAIHASIHVPQTSGNSPMNARNKTSQIQPNRQKVKGKKKDDSPAQPRQRTAPHTLLPSPG